MWNAAVQKLDCTQKAVEDTGSDYSVEPRLTSDRDTRRLTR